MEGKPAGRTHCKVCSKGLGAAHSDSGLQMNPWFFTFKKRQVKVKVKSCLTLCDPWTIAHQAPPSVEFSRQEYWSRLPFLSSGDLPDPGIEPRSSALQADTLPSEPPGKLIATAVGYKIVTVAQCVPQWTLCTCDLKLPPYTCLHLFLPWMVSCTVCECFCI